MEEQERKKNGGRDVRTFQNAGDSSRAIKTRVEREEEQRQVHLGLTRHADNGEVIPPSQQCITSPRPHCARGQQRKS
eukprot:754045-Hanusia_phi.AAC.5